MNLFRDKSFIIGATTIVVALVLWKLVSLFLLPMFLPGPILLVERMFEVYAEPGALLVVFRTLLRIFQGCVVCMILGTAIGLLMGLRRDIEAFFDSWIMVLLTFPAVCWAFLSVLWFGLSEWAPLLTVILIVFPFVAMNVWEGTKALEKDLVNMGRVYGAKRSLMIRKVLIPQIMPFIFSALRICVSLTWKIVLVGEAFGVGSGIGQKLMYWFEETQVDMMLAWGVSFMIVMTLVDLLVFRLWERRTFAWRHQIAT